MSINVSPGPLCSSQAAVKHDCGVPARRGRLKKLFQDSLKRLNAPAAREIPPDPAAARIFLWWLETPSAPGFMCEGESTGLLPLLQASFFPSFYPLFSLSGCPPDRTWGGGGDGKALSSGSCVLYFLSRLPKKLQCRDAGAPVLPNQEKSEEAGSVYLFYFSLLETNLKHLFWRRLLLSFSFKVLTKKGDGINSSWLSSGNPGLLCGTERVGKERKGRNENTALPTKRWRWDYWGTGSSLKRKMGIRRRGQSGSPE